MEVNPPGPVHEYELIPPLAVNTVNVAGHIAFVPVILQEGSGLTFSLALEDVTEPQGPVTVTRYLLPSIPAVTLVRVRTDELPPIFVQVGPDTFSCHW